jgi:flagellar basal-body rod modification protein FlgD
LPISFVSTSPTASTAVDDRAMLSDNYDTFLVLLTAQLQNQDPLSPMDSNEFTQQLVQYSQVEQQIRTNDQLETLVDQYRASSTGAALSFLGQDVIIEADETYLAGGAANWAYELPETASSLTLNVRDASGRIVYTANDAARGGGEHLFTWDGATTNGGTASDGVYTLEVIARDSANEELETTTRVRETILGVDFSGDVPIVITPAGNRDFDAIRSVLDNG